MLFFVFNAARRLLRGCLGKVFLGFLFKYMRFMIPARKLVQTSTLTAFYHPQPAYPVHILIVPRKPIPGLQALGLQEKELLSEVFETVQRLVAELGLQESGYRVIVNGGAYQELPLLHFHLVSG
jgi:histidine triad (HIT) family protein